MVGAIDTSRVLDNAKWQTLVEKALGPDWKIQDIQLKRAADGLTGFLGDHFRASVGASHRTGRTETLQLFIKRLPLKNEAKANFIDANNFFKREKLLYSLFEELGGDNGPNQWHPKVYLYDETILVMPDLAVEGFKPRHFLSTLELPEVLLTAASLARFHAAFADYSTRRTTVATRPYNLLDEHCDVMKELIMCDSPWLHAAAKLSANIINKFSDKYKNTIQDLEFNIHKTYLTACDSLRDYSGTLNVIIHRDLWVNNILFAPGKAVLIDYQCVRYAPPAFDLLSFLHLNTTREFRETYEQKVLIHYYSVFSDTVSPGTAKRLSEMGYDLPEFLRWCDRSRMFGLFFAIGIFPYVLMEPNAAQKHFDDPVTYNHYCNEDRTVPVLQHGTVSKKYIERQLEATEEFVERYLQNKL